MLVERLPDREDLYLVDTQFLGHDRHVGCYIIDDEEVALIDNGASTTVGRFLEALEKIDVSKEDVDYLLPTHVHLDHAGGTGYLVEECPNATVVCHSKGKPFLTNSEKADKLVSSAHRALGDLAPEYGDIKVIPEDRVEVMSDGDELRLGDRVLRALEASGHAPHQLCWFDQKTKGIFVADEIGMWLDGEFLPATPPPNFNYESVMNSIDRFRSLDPSSLYFAHFGLHDDPDEAFDRYKTILTDWVHNIKDLWETHEDIETVQQNVLEQGSHYFEIWDEKSARQTVETDTTGVIVYLKNERS